MTRLQWFRFGRFDRKTLKELAAQLATMTYRPDARLGFQLEETRSTYLRGRLIERIAFVETVEDPFGEKFEINRVHYEMVEFRVFEEFPNLECVSGFKAIKALRTEIAKALNFEISIENVPLDVEEFLRATAAAGTDAKITRLSVSDIELSESVRAQVSVSGSNGIRSALRDLLGKRKYIITRARAVVPCEHGTAVCEVTDGGVISSDVTLPESLIALFRQSMRGLSA